LILNRCHLPPTHPRAYLSSAASPSKGLNLSPGFCERTHSVNAAPASSLHRWHTDSAHIQSFSVASSPITLKTKSQSSTGSPLFHKRDIPSKSLPSFITVHIAPPICSSFLRQEYRCPLRVDIHPPIRINLVVPVQRPGDKAIIRVSTPTLRADHCLKGYSVSLTSSVIVHIRDVTSVPTLSLKSKRHPHPRRART
jgi:hypothetical protein